MKKSSIPRNEFIRGSFERRNNLGKGKVIQSDYDKALHDRKYQKKIFRKETERSCDDNGSFFYFQEGSKNRILNILPLP